MIRWAYAVLTTLLLGAAVLVSFHSATASRSPVEHAAISAQLRQGRETRLPVPRFVSLKASRARMRIGPSTDYGTTFIYKAQGLPIEIVAEYGNWRQVRDCDGVTGWMHVSLLSSRRTAIVGPWIKRPVALLNGRTLSGRVLVYLSARVRLEALHCDGKWCFVEVKGQHLSGFIDQSTLWGVYVNEHLD
jgi:SH3-like domain-containing protein